MNAQDFEAIGNGREWMQKGACVGLDPNIFFKFEEFEIDIAKSICGSCAVKAECLDYSIVNNIDHGVWGGKSERERRGLRKLFTQTDKIA